MSTKKKVMAIDDSKVALLNIRRMLADSEFEMVGDARTGATALQQYESLKPEVVLLDIVMPDMDGVQVLERILGADPQAKVIMVSSLGSQEKVMECTEKGARSFLMKPYEKEDLLNVLRKVNEGA
jgi:two-component system, chemotaxis family, chemotaxis protein CheY